MPNNPVPLENLELRGSWHARRKTAEANAAPAPPPAPPSTPTWLSQAAQVHWEPIAEQLHSDGLLRHCDASALAALCEGIAAYTALRDHADAKAVSVVTPSGLRPNPIRKAAAESLRDVMSMAKDLGMSPAARKGLTLTPPKAKPLPGFIDEKNLFAKG